MSLRRLAPPVLLTILILALWCLAMDRWTLLAWQTPLHLHGDPLEIYARVQAAAEDLTQPLRGFSHQPRLAAPFDADWSRYPISDRVVFTLLGELARGLGLFTAVNLALAAVHVLNALAFYATARFLRWHRAWAFALALLFSFACYNFYWAITVSFSLTFAIPPLLLLCAWIARHAPAVRPRAWTWLAVALGVWFGGANPYLLFFACQLAGWSFVLQLVRRRELARWRAGLVFIGCAAASFLLHNAAYFLADTGDASRLTLARTYAGSEIYALKLTDLVVPPSAHQIPALGTLGRAYEAQSFLRTEFSVNYLGLVALTGLALLFFNATRNAIRSRGRIPDAALGATWTLLFSAVGGINSLLAFAGLDIFRASNRNSIFLLVWALFFFGQWCQRRWQPTLLSPALRWSIALVIAAIGFVDSVPRLNAARWLKLNAGSLHTQREFLADLEGQLGANALVFQLPSTSFPEEGTVGRMTDYEHFRPYLLSSTLRFSYGALRGTDVARGLRALGALPLPLLKTQLEAAGFSALWLDRRAFPHNAAEHVAELHRLGLEPLQQTAFPDVAIFLLQPFATPRLPDLTSAALHEPWSGPHTPGQPQLSLAGGWYDLERNGEHVWRWARDQADVLVHTPTNTRVTLTFSAYSLRRGELILTYDDRELLRERIDASTRHERTVTLDLPAGRHALSFHYTGPLLYPNSPDSRKLGFAVENLRLMETVGGALRPD